MHQERAERTGAQALLDAVAREGVEVIFGYPGGAIMPLYDALFGHRVRHVLVRHEAAAIFAASGFARSSGRVGVCAATSGPGATNLITGIVDAFMDGVPLVAITGQVRTALMGTDAFQEADIAAITHAITKRNLVIRSADEIGAAVALAFRLARGPRPGPVLLDVPSDVLKAFVKSGASPAQPSAAVLPKADPEQIREAVRLLSRAERPVAIVGGGARGPKAVWAYRAFCERTGVPHAATINGIGCARPGDDRFLGMLGMHGSKAANLAVSQSDLLLAFGMRFDDRVTGRVDRFAAGASIVHADIDAAEFAKIVRADVRLHGDVAETLCALDRSLESGAPPRSFHAWSERARRLGGPLPRDRSTGSHPNATEVLDTLFELLPADAIVTTDVGQHQMWAAQRARPSQPRNFVTSAGLGAMGFGFPAAIGAAFAAPGRPVVAIVGDGGFQMSFAELATLRRYDVAVKILLIDNRNLGMVRQWQQMFYDARYSATNLSDNPDFCQIAGAYGIKAERLDDVRDLHASLARFVAEPGAMLLHCACFAEENVWPMVPAGAALDELLEAAV